MMITLEDILAGVPMPTLAVHVPGAREPRTYLLQHGMTIGRARSNAIVVEHEDVASVHARIYHVPGSDTLRVGCERIDLSLMFYSGKKVDDLPLDDRQRFAIGQVRFTCGRIAFRSPLPVEEIAPEETESPVVPAPTAAAPICAPMVRESCPRCRQSVRHLDDSARFCPHCGLNLPDHCPAWEAGAGLKLSNRALAAYAHAIFNLGLRYENMPAEIDLEQAMRYYEKAARNGVDAARARLESRARLVADERV